MPAKGLKLRFDKDALIEFRQLEKSVKESFKKKLEKLVTGTEKPSPKHALYGFPRGYYKIKLRKAGVRLIYKYDGDRLVIAVVAVGKRERSVVYEVARRREVSRSKNKS
jgi:mRNA interferase RelE/StbE